jgi:hypothetical protein
MEIHEIAEAWLETPKGRKWAIERISTDLRKLPSLATYDDNLVRSALPGLTSPKLLLAALREGTGVTTEQPSYIGVPLESATDTEPWRLTELPFDVCADLLGIGRADLASSWGDLTGQTSVPVGLTGWNVLLVDVYRWLDKTTHARPDRFVRSLMSQRPVGGNWAIVVRRGRAEIHSAPLKLDVSAYRGVRAFYDPIERIEAIEIAAEACVDARSQTQTPAEPAGEQRKGRP